MTGAILLLLIICGIAFFLMKKKASGGESSKGRLSKSQAASLPYSKDELRIENVEAGGMIHVSGIGENVDEFDVSILAKHLYREGGSSWYELEGESVNGKVWIDLEEDDGLTLTITLKKMKLRDLGITKKDLTRIDDDEEGDVTYQGQKYYYEDSDKATFYKYGDETNGEHLYYWDFENEAGNQFIGVERWSDGTYDVSYSEPIATHQVSVFSLKK